MSGYTGMVLVGGILVAIILLRGGYRKPSSTKSWYEELATYAALLLFVSSVSLTVARSPEGIERFRRDINQTIPYSLKHIPLSVGDVALQLSSVPLDKKSPRANCSTCHAPRIALMSQLGNSVSKDGNIMENEVAKLLKPLREALNNNREVVRHLPKADPGQGVWKKFAAWLTADGRQERKMQQHAQMKQHESALIESRIKQIEAYYKIETFQKLKKNYVSRVHSASIPLSVHYLLLTADNNSSFYKTLRKGDQERSKAAWSLRILEWGVPLFVVTVLLGRILLRSRYPDAEWYIFPGMVLFAGISLQLMTDLSLNYLPKLRFIAFYHWRNTAGSLLFLLLVTPAFGLPVVKRLLVKSLEMVRLKSLKASLALCLIMLIAAAGGYLMPAERYKVAEILKLLLVGVLAWYAVSRGDYISRKTAMTGLRGEGWIINNLLEFLLLSLSVVIAFLTIHDFGPLLVTLLFLCAYMWLLMGTGKLLAVLSVWTGGIALALSFRGLLTQLAGVAYLFRRFDEMAEPFRQGTGEIAKLHWLRSSAGLLGHDLGQLPYYGRYIQSIGSTTVITPAQIQSDYSATHVVAVWGYLPGLLLLFLYLVWLLAVFTSGARMASALQKSLPARFVGWWLALAALMLTIQALLTFAGNFAIAPLSGLTMPMVSYGSATMLFCTLVMSLSYAKENMS